MKRRRVTELEGGERLAKPIVLETGIVLIYENTVLKQEYIEKLTELGIKEVYILETSPKDTLALEEQVRQEYSDKVKSLLERHIYKDSENIGELSGVAQSIFDEVIEQKEVMDCVIEIHEHSADIYEHSVSTCVLSVITALKLGINYQDAKEIAVGSLLHDIGIRYIDVDYVGKELSELSAYEASEFKKHPVYGYSAVEKEEWLSQTAKSVILSHHECIDGSGYPLHTRTNEKICQIVTVCDAFDSMICGIGYRQKKVHEAIEYVRYYSGIKFNKQVCDIFLQCIFLYPNGTKVVLNTGEEAVVVGQNKERKERPKVRLIKTNQVLDMMEIKTIFIERTI